MGDESQPRAFVAHQQMLDLFLVALIAKHSDPQGLMRQFRELVGQLTAATPELVREFEDPRPGLMEWCNNYCRRPIYYTGSRWRRPLR